MVARQLSGALSSAVGLAAAQTRAEELAELDRAKTEFFSNVSHEFRTPLTLMLGPLGDALADPDPDPAVQRERIEIAHRGALRLLRLVNTLLDLSRFEAGPRRRRASRPVDLGRLARETAAVFRAAAERSGLELRVDAPEDGATIDADADMVEKILLNLLSNAYKFTLRGPDRAARADRRAGGDRGRRQRRRHPARPSCRGCSSASIASSGAARAQPRGQRHRARARRRARRAPRRRGSVVERRRRRAAPSASSCRCTRPAPASRRAGDEALADAQRDGFAQEALRWGDGERTIDRAAGRRAGGRRCSSSTTTPTCASTSRGCSETDYAVRTAVDGADALEQLAERLPDLVLTDVMMPRLDGFELLARLREDPRTQRLPVIVLSARAGEEATVEGLDAGADDYLVKPFSGPELLARVHANLEVTRLRDALAAGERDRAREMEDVALTLQRSLLPRELPDVLGAELCGRYVPASESLEIGGDFYDATALGDGRVVITIGDVAGHGVLAAAVMGQVRQAVRAYAFEGHPPAALMDRLDLLVSDSDLAMTTCLCGIFDPATGTLRFSNAGHPPPLIRRADGTRRARHRRASATRSASRWPTGTRRPSVDARASATRCCSTPTGSWSGAARSSTSGSTALAARLAAGFAERRGGVRADRRRARRQPPRRRRDPRRRAHADGRGDAAHGGPRAPEPARGAAPPAGRLAGPPTAPRARRPTTSCSPPTRRR